jgi:cytochrome bd-type quinol oxidase subunit 1
MFIFPVMGWFGAVWLLDENSRQKWVAIPSSILAKGTDQLLYVKIGLALVIIFVLYFLFQLVSFFVLRLVGPDKYGPMDIPRVSWKGRRRSR